MQTKHKLKLTGLVLTFLVLAASPKKTFAAPAISNISDNKNSYANSQVPKYDKFEVNSSITTAASNMFFPYDEMATPIPGLTPKLGISVDGLFLPPGENNWANAVRQPGFYFVEYTENGSLYYPTGKTYWKVRFAPDKVGTWQYKITARDASGLAESPIQSFSVTDSASHGFIQVSPNDSRYFQFSDGTYFPGQMVNDSLDKNNPTANQSFLNKLGSNGIQVLRFWLSNWTIFGSTWTPWEGIKGIYDGYLPRAGLITYRAESTPAQPQSVLTLVYSESNGAQNEGSWFDSCYSTVAGGSQVKIATKANTSYRIKIRYQAKGITGPRNSAYSGYGLALKKQNPNDGNWHGECYNGGDPANGVKLTGYGRDTPGWTKDSAGTWTSPNWSYLESDWASTGTYSPILYLALENVNNMAATIDGGKGYDSHPYAYIDSIEIRENLDNGQYGPNIVPRSSFSFLEHVDDRNAYAFDKVVDLATKEGVYLKTVLLDKNEQVANEIGQNGLRTNFSNNNFYGNWRNPQATRWLNGAWFRYAQARWGYSTSIHSWELVNEGDPSNGNHYALTDELGKYMHCSAFGIQVGSGDGQKCTYTHPNRHMVTTSFWYGFPKTDFWGNSKYPNIDYADVHDYINKPTESARYYDTALATYELGQNYGAKQPNGANMPVVRGETGLITDDGTDAISNEVDSKGVWLHNFIWGGINSYGATEAWWHVSQIYSGGRDLRPLYKQYYDFINTIPLNNGRYQDAQATASDGNVRAWGQKNNVGQTANHAHLWVQNKKHLWCAVNSTPGCPVSWDGSRLNGTVKISGFTPNTNYPVEWWNFDNSVNLSKSSTTVTSDSAGQITLDLTSLPSSVTDTGVKIGNYSQNQSPPPSTPPATLQGDVNKDKIVNLLDYTLLSNAFGTNNTSADIDGSGMVNILDYTILSTNFGQSQ